MKLIIERTKWLRGEIKARLLRSDDQKMCCLGFFAKACGYADEEILDEGDPAELLNDMPGSKPNRWPQWMVSFKELDEGGRVFVNADDTEALMECNDNIKLTEPVREKMISAIFRSNGVQVEFV